MDTKVQKPSVLQRLKPYMTDMNFSLTVAIIIVGAILAFQSPFFLSIQNVRCV